MLLLLHACVAASLPGCPCRCPCPCLCGSASSYFAPVPTPTTRRWSLAWLALAVAAPADSMQCMSAPPRASRHVDRRMLVGVCCSYSCGLQPCTASVGNRPGGGLVAFSLALLVTALDYASARLGFGEALCHCHVGTDRAVARVCRGDSSGFDRLRLWTGRVR